MVCREENNFMVTHFQNKVYGALKLIPKGKVTTYKLLADFIECKSSQAIGQALTRNPRAPEVPCHRVIRTDGTIGWYAFWVQKKWEILKSEWVLFDLDNAIVEKGRIWDFS